MKQLILITGLLAVLAACNNNKTTPVQSSAPPADVQATQQAAEVPNSADLDFNQALDAFRAKNNAGAAHYISTAIEDLKKEQEPALNAKAAKQLDATISTLQDLEAQVKEGNVTDIDSLSDIFAHVDMLAAHDYLVLTQLYAVESPDKATDREQKASLRIENAVKKLKGEPQQEGKSILDNVRASLAKGDRRADAIGNAAGEQVVKVTNWLNVHAAKLGIHHPPITHN